MTNVISVGIQKGGSGKTTTASMLAYILSQNQKVLAIDMDGQGNMTQAITGVDDIYEFDGKSIYNALLDENAAPYIIKVTDNLHILAGDENINTLGSHFYIELRKQRIPYMTTLLRTIQNIKDEYDYIVIDNPPALGELSIVSLSASDFVVIMYEPKKFCYSSLKRYLLTIEVVQQRVNPKLKIAGILQTMLDNRRTDYKYYSELVRKEFGDLVFKTIIHRNAVIGRMDAFGIFGNPEIRQLTKFYQPFVEELISRVQELSKQT